MKSGRTVIVMLAALFFAGSPAKYDYEVGDNATDFKLKNVDGKIISLADYKDARGFIVIFHCNTCPYAKAYDGRIISLNKKYAPLKFPVIAINANDPENSSGDSFEENIRESRRKGYDFPYLIDRKSVV